ncbi:unnamed protein product [Pleuronectes platessa]|uniref:Uncharacterized protein n=1 Tax=Pleuronectes platessa TaxID=8262 RepID=A0A9N7U728_PLEPL|nr:unnamed protein product [Pleuronectes platessa]
MTLILQKESAGHQDEFTVSCKKKSGKGGRGEQADEEAGARQLCVGESFLSSPPRYWSANLSTKATSSRSAKVAD